MRVLKRRREEGKTDYLKRLKLLKSGVPRIVFRKTNRYVIGQYIISKETKDFAEIGVSSKQFLKKGWPKEFAGSLKSTPASYLVGFDLGRKIVKGEKKTSIVDFGMIRNIHKAKSFAFLKGLVDAGVKIKCDKETFPEDERIKGKHLKNDFSKFFEKIKSTMEKE